MNTRHSTAYEQLAVQAARQAGLKKTTAEAAAADDGACQIRDSLWEQYERMLRDTQTYRLAQIRSWLAERGVKASKSSVHRDQTALLDKEQAIGLAAAKARAVIEAAEASGEHDVLKAARLQAGQLLFNALCNLSSAALEGLAPHQVLRMVDSLGELSKAHAATALMQEKLAEIQRKLDAEKAKADKAAEKVLSDRGVDAKTIDKIRALYGLPPLKELAA